MKSLILFSVRLVRRTLDYPRATILIALAIGSVCAVYASGIRLDTSFAALLPDDTPEVIEVDELSKKTGGTAELILAIAGANKQRLTVARRIVAALESKPWIQQATAEFPAEFFLDRRLLLASEKKLRLIRDKLRAKIERETSKKNPFYVDLEEDHSETQPKKTITWEKSLSDQFRVDGPSLKKTFTSRDGRFLFVRVKPKQEMLNFQEGGTLLKRIEHIANRCVKGTPGVSIRYAGRLFLNQVQHHQMGADFKRASIIAGLAILLLMTLFTRRVITPIVIAVPLLIGIAVTLAIVRLAIGQLNLVSGFLISALFGLGIDYEIHLFRRYLEELPRFETRLEAIRKAVRSTYPGCLTAALTSSAAFFAIATSNFRGFREYGLIAGLGILFSLISSFIVLPSIALLLARKGRQVQRHTSGDLSPRLAGAVIAPAGVLLVLAAVLSPGVRWHNDFMELRGTGPTIRFSDTVADDLGGSLSPAAVFVPESEHVPKVQDYLDSLAQHDSSMIKRSLSLASMVPRHAEARLQLIADIRRQLQKILGQNLSEDHRKKAANALKLTDVRPWSVHDVPDVYKQRFLPVSGAGQFVMVWPDRLLHEDTEVIAWGKTLDSLKRSLHRQGIAVQILDQNRVAARVLTEMHANLPYLMAAVVIAIFVILALDFATWRPVATIVASLAVGVIWMLGVMSYFGLELNVFNQAILPTIIGLGLDNAVHIQHRYRTDGPGTLGKVLRTTGLSATLASSTTAVGFGAAISAHHLGIRSLGWLAIVGTVCTFISSTIVLPAALRLLERRNHPRALSNPKPT